MNIIDEKQRKKINDRIKLTANSTEKIMADLRSTYVTANIKKYGEERYMLVEVSLLEKIYDKLNEYSKLKDSKPRIEKVIKTIVDKYIDVCQSSNNSEVLDFANEVIAIIHKDFGEKENEDF